MAQICGQSVQQSVVECGLGWKGLKVPLHGLRHKTVDKLFGRVMLPTKRKFLESQLLLQECRLPTRQEHALHVSTCPEPIRVEKVNVGTMVRNRLGELQLHNQGAECETERIKLSVENVGNTVRKTTWRAQARSKGHVTRDEQD